MKTICLLAAMLLLAPSLQAQNRKQNKGVNSSEQMEKDKRATELLRFEEFVVKAKNLGATHVDVTFSMPPAWASRHISISVNRGRLSGKDLKRAYYLQPLLLPSTIL